MGGVVDILIVGCLTTMIVFSVERVISECFSSKISSSTYRCHFCQWLTMFEKFAHRPHILQTSKSIISWLRRLTMMASTLEQPKHIVVLG